MTDDSVTVSVPVTAPVTTPALEMRGITKRYPGVVANNKIDLGYCRIRSPIDGRISRKRFAG